MPSLPVFQIDAFADKPFQGNPACVIALEADFLPDATLQAIAAENNVSETAFIVADAGGVWQLRWFTPATEVPLCGHATLAAAHMLFVHQHHDGDDIRFRTRQSGELTVRRNGAGYEMDFPAPEIFETPVTDEIAAALGARPLRAWGGPFLAAQFATPQDIIALSPDLRALATLGVSGHGGTCARGNFGCFAHGGDGVDVTSRFFAPGSGINEDPATGSWHCMLAVVVAQQGGPSQLSCHQAFAGRGARISTRLDGDRVRLGGNAVTVIEGHFRL